VALESDDDFKLVGGGRGGELLVQSAAEFRGLGKRTECEQNKENGCRGPPCPCGVAGKRECAHQRCFSFGARAHKGLGAGCAFFRASGASAQRCAGVKCWWQSKGPRRNGGSDAAPGAQAPGQVV